MKEIVKNYNAQEFEQNIYKQWEESGMFQPEVGRPLVGNSFLFWQKKKHFSISLPPPNATGVLHLGHAAMLAYQDTMIRYHRMLGEDTLWVPGTDHAAIATQNVVEKKIAKEQNKTKEDLGREEFLNVVREFVAGTQDNIRNQIRRMGSSLDWSRERYTFSDSLSRAVNMSFKKMYDDGLIYRGYRIVNWCPRCHSTLSDDEVEYKTQKTRFYYFKYGPVVIGTARPETKFADKVIIVHPDDDRFKDLIGKKFMTPWIEGDIEATVIADESADPELGTGAMTITPAHSFVDYELAKKHNLEVKKIIDEDGNLTAEAGMFAGMNAHDAREKIVKAMAEKGLVDHIDEDYEHNLSVCYRCETPIEPLPSEQWFVDVNKKILGKGKSLKELSTDVVKSGKINIVPDKFTKVYFNWMNNLHDWCISRQIWWGHRIPVWYKGEDIYVGVNPPEGDDWTQDEDTLDTWFSSALWTFSTLLDQDFSKYNSWAEWIKNSPDLKRFHPTSVMETGYDILFFWVARMILMTTYLLDEIPFEAVYLHGLIRDKQGRKMSKSLGNGIDPIAMIDKFGADALRLSMMVGATPGNDMRLYEEKIEGYRNFVNKLWNISRYIIGSVKDVKIVVKKPEAKTVADAWILSELDKLIEITTKNLDALRFSPAIEGLYEFTWSKFADWYIEISKVETNKDEILLYVLEQLIKMWHPFSPFVTEAIWENFDNGQLIINKWPVKASKFTKLFKKTKGVDFDIIRDVITSIRNAKGENKIGADKIINCRIDGSTNLITNNITVIERLAKVKLVPDKDASWLGLHIKGLDIALDIDKNEVVKLQTKQREELEKYISLLKKKLSNDKFVNNAPVDVVALEREKLLEAEAKLAKLS